MAQTRMTTQPHPVTSEQAAVNTDKEIWRERPGDFYADSLFVTEDGRIGMDRGGTVFVKSVKEWCRIALDESNRRTTPAAGQSEPIAIAEIVLNPYGGKRLDWSDLTWWLELAVGKYPLYAQPPLAPAACQSDWSTVTEYLPSIGNLIFVTHQLALDTVNHQLLQRTQQAKADFAALKKLLNALPPPPATAEGKGE